MANINNKKPSPLLIKANKVNTKHIIPIKKIIKTCFFIPM